jgi:hypothetical protein
MRRELRQCPVTLTGDSDRIHRKAIVHAPPERLYLSATSRASQCEGFRSWTTGTHKLKIQGRCGMSTILINLGLVLVVAVVVWLVGGSGIG